MPLPRTLRHATASIRLHRANPTINSSRTLLPLSPLSRTTPPHRRPHAHRTYTNGPNPTPGQSPFRVWPFILITLAGTASYALMVRSRSGTSLPPLHIPHPPNNPPSNTPPPPHRPPIPPTTNTSPGHRPSPPLPPHLPPTTTQTNLHPPQHLGNLRPGRPRRRQRHAMRTAGGGLRLHAPLSGRPAASGAGPTGQPVRGLDTGVYPGRADRADGGDGAVVGECDGRGAEGEKGGEGGEGEVFNRR